MLRRLLVIGFLFISVAVFGQDSPVSVQPFRKFDLGTTPLIGQSLPLLNGAPHNLVIAGFDDSVRKLKIKYNIPVDRQVVLPKKFNSELCNNAYECELSPGETVTFWSTLDGERGKVKFIAFNIFWHYQDSDDCSGCHVVVFVLPEVKSLPKGSKLFKK